VLSLHAGGRLPLVFGYALVPRAEAPVALELRHDAFRLDATLRIGWTEFVMTVVQGDVEISSREL
jgi:hypothetical protein